jgi:Trypsin-like peptidase domain
MIISAIVLALFSQGEIARDVYKKVLPSVVTIKTDTGQGSGYVTKSDGVVITCAHVVNDAKKVTVTFSDGESYESTGLIDRDDVNDLAAIRVRFSDRPVLVVSRAKLEIGENIFVVGAPLGLEFSISQGIVSQIRKVDDRSLIQHSCGTSPGNSGGPVVNSKAEVVGIHTSKMKGGENLNFATPVSFAESLDLTLSTRRWVDIEPSPSSKDKDADPDSSDAELVQYANEIWTALEEVFQARDMVYDIMIEVTTKSPGNAIIPDEVADVPFKMGELAKDLENLSEKAKGTYLEQELLDATTSVLNCAVAYVNLKKNVESARQYGWTSSINTVFDNNFAKVLKPITSEKLSKFLIEFVGKSSQSGSFRYHFDGPTKIKLGELRTRLGVDLRIEGMPVLGFGRVFEKGLGRRLGFESGDSIVSIEGKEKQDVVSGLLSCLDSKGSTFIVQVWKHGGSSKKMKIKIPG